MEKKVASSLSHGVSAAAPAAERAVNKALNKNAYDESDLVQQMEAGTIKLDKIAESDLPDELKALPAAERQAKLDKSLQERKQLRSRIVELSKQRESYLAEQVRKGKVTKTGFDAAVASALEKQLN
ncbi:MAG: hypothetical protein HYZ45_07595 [Burkholderiales bacterium]|nr:hypothetical protein [Burkholderiales bacterium]